MKTLLGLLLVISAPLAVACGGQSKTEWSAITASPGASAHVGEPESTPRDLFEERLDSVVSERGLVVVERRIEELPAGVDWTTHLAFRDDNVGGMTRTDERIPEPDRPVLLAEYRGGDRQLFVIAHTDTAGEHLIVLTALAESM